MAFPDEWSYYKEYEQPGSADGELTDYQVAITVTYITDKMRSDFGDIRFTLEDLTELSYHLVSYTESDEALFVVKIPTIPTTGVTIRCYYGNSGATTTSDPENTYDVYDGFDDGSLDTDKWTWIRESTGNWDEGTTQSGKLNIKTLNLELHGSTNNAPVLRLHNPIAGNFIAECTLELSPTVNYQRGCLLIYSDDNNYIEMGYIYNSGQSGTNIFAKKEITATPLDYYTHVSISSLKVRIIKLGTTYYLYYDAGSGWTLFQTFTGIPFSTIYVALASESYSGGGSGLNVFYDDVKVSKYTANPPASGTFGSEVTLLQVGNAVASGLPLVMYNVPMGEATASGLPVVFANWELINIGNATASGLELEKWYAYTPSFFIENEDGIILKDLSFESLFPGKKSLVQKLTAINNLESEMVMTLTPGESFNQLGDGLDTYLSHYLSSDGLNWTNQPLSLVIPTNGELDFYTYWQPPSTAGIGWKQWLLDLELDVPSLEGWSYVSWFTVTGMDVAVEVPYTLDSPVRVDFVYGLMKEDFRDIRFALDDHTVLKHDLVNKVDGDHAYFYVQLPEIPATPGEVMVYVYSGNEDVVDVSDDSVYDTLPLRDYFPPPSLDPIRWEPVEIISPPFGYEVNNYLRLSGWNHEGSIAEGKVKSKWVVPSEFNIECNMTNNLGAGCDVGFELSQSDDTCIVRVLYWSSNGFRKNVRLITEGIWSNVTSGWSGSETNTLEIDIGYDTQTRTFNMVKNGSTISIYMDSIHIADTTISSTPNYLKLSGIFNYLASSNVRFNYIEDAALPVPTIGEVEPAWINIYPIPVQADVLYQPRDLPLLNVERRFGARIGGTLFE